MGGGPLGDGAGVGGVRSGHRRRWGAKMGTQGWQGEPHGHGEPKERCGSQNQGNKGASDGPRKVASPEPSAGLRLGPGSQAGAWLSGAEE